MTISRNTASLSNANFYGKSERIGLSQYQLPSWKQWVTLLTFQKVQPQKPIRLWVLWHPNFIVKKLVSQVNRHFYDSPMAIERPLAALRCRVVVSRANYWVFFRSLYISGLRKDTLAPELHTASTILWKVVNSTKTLRDLSIEFSATAFYVHEAFTSAPKPFRDDSFSFFCWLLGLSTLVGNGQLEGSWNKSYVH